MSEPGSQEQPDDALVDLVIKQVTEGLSPAEQRALDALDSGAISQYLRDFERAAAAVSLAGVAPMQAPPAALRERLEQQARGHFSANGGVTNAGAANNVVDINRSRTAGPVEPRRASRGAAGGWIAAAACLLLAIFAWYRPAQPILAPVADTHVSIPPLEPLPAPPPPTAAEARAALVAKAESIKVTLSPTKDPAAAGVSGDVVWDPATQKGFVRFVGLATNDPHVRQYQIWIFDGERDKRYPVDGGVFDVPADSPEVVIPINAALPVHLAKAFAVTVEKSGGAVVSTRDRVVALGAAG